MSENSSLPAKKRMQVKRQGRVITAYVTEQGEPLPIPGYEVTPIGGLPQTFFSEKEVTAAFPNFDVEYLTPPERPAPPVVKPVAAEKIRQVVGHSTPELERRRHSAPAPVYEDQSKSRVLSLIAKGKAKAFRDKLSTAHKYASKKNQRILTLKLEAVDELIAEVFPSERTEEASEELDS